LTHCGSAILSTSGDDQGRYAHALILLRYPLDMRFPAPVEQNDLDACLANYGKPGYEVGMLGNFYSIVACQLGDRSLANRLLLSVLHSYPHAPFYAMTETPTNGRAVFLTGEGAFLQQIIFGFTGLRFTAKGLTPEYHPELPAAWSSLELHNIVVRGKRVDVRVDKSGNISMAPPRSQ
jgi:protein-glucosylgalactosylhydroxylysine glucosidase